MIRSTVPSALAQVDLVADAVLVLDEHEQAGDAVPDEGLGAEPEGDAGDAGGRDQRGEVDAELAEDHDAGDHPDQHGGGRGHDRRDRRRPSLPTGVGDRGPSVESTPTRSSAHVPATR